MTELAVAGELDLSTAALLGARVEATFREPGARVQLDLARA